MGFLKCRVPVLDTYEEGERLLFTAFFAFLLVL